MRDLTRVVVRAPAKVNLFFEITGLAPNGYHLVDSVMQAVTLSDTLTASRVARPGIRVSCARPGVPQDKGNLAHHAAAAFIDAAGLRFSGGLDIHIDKQIPHQAGLGGGSADAVAALAALNRLFGANLPPERLREIALPLGADVPFALLGGCARARGIGELLEPLSPAPPPEAWLVIAKPGAGVSTPAAFAAYDGCTEISHRPIEPMLNALRSTDPAQIGACMFNVFEQALPGEHTRRIKAAMLAAGALGAALSGSGSAVCGLFGSRVQAESCLQSLPALCGERFLAQPQAAGVEIISTE